jgi:hypothetical protein
MELSCRAAEATTTRRINNDTTGASKVPPKAALRAVMAPLRDGRPGSWSDWLARRLQAISRLRFAARNLAKRLLELASRTTLGATTKVLFGGEGCDLLGKGKRNELIQRDALLFSKFPC